MIANEIGASQVWRKMIQIRDVMEHNIWWQFKAGSSSFLFDNWTKMGHYTLLNYTFIQRRNYRLKILLCGMSGIDRDWLHAYQIHML